MEFDQGIGKVMIALGTKRRCIYPYIGRPLTLIGNLGPNGRAGPGLMALAASTFLKAAAI